MTITIRHLIIHGRVQGVGYRAWTAATARQYRLTGWVRNRNDGTVEAVFAGPQDIVAAMITACRTGPEAARVSQIDARDGSDGDLNTGGAPKEFLSLPTV